LVSDETSFLTVGVECTIWRLLPFIMRVDLTALAHTKTYESIDSPFLAKLPEADESVQLLDFDPTST